MIEPYIIVKSNNKYYIGVGPMFGIVNNQDDYIYIKLDSIDLTTEYINGLYNVTNAIELYYFIVNNESLIYGQDVFISYGLYNILLEVNDSFSFFPLDEIEEIPHNTNLFEFINKDINDFTDEELDEFYVTFMKQILNYADIDNVDFSDNMNTIYLQVIQYFANYSNNDIVDNLDLILGTAGFEYVDTNKYATGYNCQSCSTSTTLITNSLGNSMPSNYSSLSCTDKYKEAMKMWLIHMLGNYKFYNDWFFVENNDEYNVNEWLIDSLLKLINEFLEKNSILNTKGSISHCNCELTTDDSQSTINILNNYIKVLNWVKECQIDQNINKIKLYGEQFGEILPSLFLN